MKEHAKKALKHNFEVAGKTIPTLALVALLFVGTGSAALLSSFGTVSGDATVEQAVQFTDKSFDSADLTAGDTMIRSTTIENNAEQPVTVQLDGTLQNSDDSIADFSYTLISSDHELQSTNSDDELTDKITTAVEGTVSGDSVTAEDYYQFADYTSELVHRDSGVAVHVEGELPSKSEVEYSSGSAGVVFNGLSEPYDSSKEVTVDAENEGGTSSPDWISAEVNLGSTVTLDYANSEQTVSTDSVNLTNFAVSGPATFGELGQFVTVNGEQVTVDFANHPDAEVTELRVFSGTARHSTDIDGDDEAESLGLPVGSGDASDIYYTDVAVDGDSLMAGYDNGGQPELDANSSYTLVQGLQFPVTAPPSEDGGYSADTTLLTTESEDFVTG